jgi:hypothetical protein
VATPATPGPPPAEAHFVIPGDYRQGTTVMDLQARFGKANTRVVEDPERSLVLFPDDPSRRARVTFHDSDELEELASIQVTDPGSRWRGKHGVRVGMSLKEIRALNGKPFNFFSSLDGSTARVHDQWSVALDDDDGSLGRFDVEEGEHVYFEVEFGARDPATLPRPFPPDESLSSDDPRLAGKDEALVVTGFGGSTSLDDEWD